MSYTKRMPFYQDVDGFRVPGIFLPDAVRSAIKYKPKPEDIFIVTFPKCGTMWTQQIATLIFDKGIPVTNFAEFNRRSPFLEMCGAEAVALMKGLGLMKLHTPYCLTPMSTEAKYLYVVRNPKDTVVSFYHHTRNGSYNFKHGTFDEFFEIFMNGENDFGDYFDHILSWYEHRNDPNVMFLLFEQLKLDTRNTVMKIAKFMGDEYGDMLQNDPQILKNVLKYSSVEQMKKFNDMWKSFKEDSKLKPDLENITPGFEHFTRVASEINRHSDNHYEVVRKGKVGDWRSSLSEDQNRRLDAKIEEKLKGTTMYSFWKNSNCI